MAIAIHSFGSLEELLDDKSGLREKALEIVSDEIFQAIVSRDLLLPPQLFPNREEEDMLRRRREALQRRQQQETHTPSILRIPGVNTSMQAIASFLDRVIHEVLNDEELYTALERKLKLPFGKDPFQMLEQLQNSEIGSYAHFLAPDNTEAPLGKEVLSRVEAKGDGEEEDEGEEREEETKDLQQRKQELKQLVATSKEVHQRLLFNCFNQALDEQRPYGVDGAPMPWTIGSKLLEVERS